MRAWIGVAALMLCACGDISGGASKSGEPQAEQRAPAAPASAPVSTIRTASDARYQIEQQGFSDVAALAQDASGQWTATAKLDGRAVNVKIDAGGIVTIVEPAAK